MLLTGCMEPERLPFLNKNKVACSYGVLVEVTVEAVQGMVRDRG